MDNGAKLTGRVAIITGASQGLGKTIAKKFLEHQAAVVICARNETDLEAAHKELLSGLKDEQRKERLSSMVCDVTNTAAVDKLVQHALTEHGCIDIVVNNAGVYGPMGSLEEVDFDEWRKAIDVNLIGPVLLLRAVLKTFKEKRSGKVINLSGGGATAPLPGISAYAAAKAGLVRLTETLAEETRAYGIDINAIAPGALNTRMLDQVLNNGPELVGKKFYYQSLKQKENGGASLDRAAELCVFLASDESNGITGRLISAVWDQWPLLRDRREALAASDIYTLRRIVPADRGIPDDWGTN